MGWGNGEERSRLDNEGLVGGHCWEEGEEGESGQKVDRNMIDRKKGRREEEQDYIMEGRRRGADEVSDR